MKLYLLTNERNGKQYVGLSFGSEDPVSHHGKHKIIPDMHRDIRAGDPFTMRVLLTPRNLATAERMEKLYIKTLKPEYNDQNGKTGRTETDQQETGDRLPGRAHQIPHEGTEPSDGDVDGKPGAQEGSEFH